MRALAFGGNNTMAYYWLTPPSRAVFFISVLLAVLALLVRYARRSYPGGQQPQFRDTVDRLPAAIGWQLVQRFLATVPLLAISIEPARFGR